MEKIQKIESVLGPILKSYGYCIVQSNVFCLSKKSTLQIMIENLNMNPITLKDCTLVSRILTTHVDVEKLIPNKFIIEISSSGINRPLTNIRDYERFVGNKITLKLKNKIDEKRYFKGILKKVFKEGILLDLSKSDNQDNYEEMEFLWNQIESGTLDKIPSLKNRMLF